MTLQPLRSRLGLCFGGDGRQDVLGDGEGEGRRLLDLLLGEGRPFLHEGVGGRDRRGHQCHRPGARGPGGDDLAPEVLVTLRRDELEVQATAWEENIDTLAGEDEEMASYIAQLEQARDTVDSPEASGDAIAEEFEKYLRKRDGDQPPTP